MINPLLRPCAATHMNTHIHTHRLEGKKNKLDLTHDGMFFRYLLMVGVLVGAPPSPGAPEGRFTHLVGYMSHLRPNESTNQWPSAEKEAGCRGGMPTEAGSKPIESFVRWSEEL